MLHRLRRHSAIRACIRRLPGHLRGGYGVSRSDTEAHIRQGAKRHGLNRSCAAYAAVLFAADLSNGDDPRRTHIDDDDLIKVDLIDEYFGGSDGSFWLIHASFNSPSGDATDSATPSSGSSGANGGHRPYRDGHGLDRRGPGARAEGIDPGGDEHPHPGLQRSAGRIALAGIVVLIGVPARVLPERVAE